MHDPFEAALRVAARLGGDTDTVAAMAGAVAGARGGHNGIPTRWLEALEDGDRGRSHVQTLIAPGLEPIEAGKRTSIRATARGWFGAPGRQHLVWVWPSDAMLEALVVRGVAASPARG